MDPDITSTAFEQERERLHRQMLSSVSHDLKTPLAAVIGSLEIYRRIGGQISEEKRATLIATALEEAYRLDNFVSNILDMAKLEMGAVRPRRERCELHALMKECIEKSCQRTNGTRIQLTTEITPVYLYTDPALVCRIIHLLLDNAVKHAGAEVELRLEQSDDHVILKAQDRGPGIPAERMEDIFSKHTRIKREDRQNAGTGLGLSIARGLALLLGGTLAAENREDGGAAFTFTLPLHAS